jgi:hypothetical protein
LEGRRGEKKLLDGILMIFTFDKYCSGDQFKEDEVREKRDTNGEEETWLEELVGKTKGKRQGGRMI